jgi:hypothetical protein
VAGKDFADVVDAVVEGAHHGGRDPPATRGPLFIGAYPDGSILKLAQQPDRLSEVGEGLG